MPFSSYFSFWLFPLSEILSFPSPHPHPLGSYSSFKAPLWCLFPNLPVQRLSPLGSPATTPRFSFHALCIYSPLHPTFLFICLYSLEWDQLKLVENYEEICRLSQLGRRELIGLQGCLNLEASAQFLYDSSVLWVLASSSSWTYDGCNGFTTSNGQRETANFPSLSHWSLWVHVSASESLLLIGKATCWLGHSLERLRGFL